MFGRKKKDLPAGARMMHYEGLRGFSQDGPCFMERTEAGLVFRQTNGPAATLPLEKVTGLEMMPERNFMARYHGTAATTAYGKAVKWFAVFHYTTQEGGADAGALVHRAQNRQRPPGAGRPDRSGHPGLHPVKEHKKKSRRGVTLSGSLALFGLFLVKLGNGLFQFIKAKHGGVCHEKCPGPQRPLPCTRRWPRP